ncbi:MAG: 1-phosphofructokinase family hexose kinase [Tepidanaerobacteraceae bacterium]|nr:1-phosphofructokinase family hexose kinase [Tepidanaerobacteraceae bacterium]
MITTLTLNPCIDKTVVIGGFKYGGLNRVIDTRTDASGKGINVSIVISQLGEQTKCLGFNFLNGKNLVCERLEKHAIPYEFIDVEGTLRTNIKIFDRESGIMTELNESGHCVREESVALLKELVVSNVKDTEIMVFNGSVPAGVPKDIYGQLIEKANYAGVKTILDAEGELLLEGIKSGPFFIKPNLYEFETAFGIKVKDVKDVVKVSKGIIESGVKIVCVSLGKDGAVLVSRDGAWYSPALRIKVRGVQGAGDSLVAGVCIALRRGLELPEMLRYGMAAAHASLLRDGTLLCTREDFDNMLSKIKVEKIIA